MVAIALYDTAVRDVGVQCLSALRYPRQGRPRASQGLYADKRLCTRKR
jgi:hypothetical protein